MSGADLPAGAFIQPISPRFYEIDGQGIMFNMWYLAYVDEAVVGFFEDRKLPYAEWSQRLGVDVHVAHVELDWAAPLTAADSPNVVMSTGHVGTKSFALDFAFRRGEQTTCTGQIVYVCVASDGSGPVPVPDELRRALGDVIPLRERG